MNVLMVTVLYRTCCSSLSTFSKSQFQPLFTCSRTTCSMWRCPTWMQLSFRYTTRDDVFCPLLVAAWYVEIIIVYCFFLCMCVSVMPSTKLINFGSRYLVEGFSEGDEIWPHNRGALLYITTQIGELWPRRFPGAPKYWNVYKIVILFSYIVWPSAVKFGMIRGICA